MSSSVIGRAGRQIYRAFPGLRPVVHAYRLKLRYLKTALYYLEDAKYAYRFMRWDRKDHGYWKLSSELIFLYHKLEKGLCIPGEPRFFGENPFFETVSLIKRWREAGYSLQDPIYLGAMEALCAYRDRVSFTPPPEGSKDRIHATLQECLRDYPRSSLHATPRKVVTVDQSQEEQFRTLCFARRSVRSYSNKDVPFEVVKQAVEIAQLSPSACNRQPWRVHVYQGREKIDSMLELQNGNKGFGNTIPLLLVLTAEMNAFFDSSERNQLFIDSGLFAMSLLLALQAKGLSTCCLNWCVAPDVDREGHRRGRIPENERIVMYLAVGYSATEASVPYSSRRNVDSLLFVHG